MMSHVGYIMWYFKGSWVHVISLHSSIPLSIAMFTNLFGQRRKLAVFMCARYLHSLGEILSLHHISIITASRSSY